MSKIRFYVLLFLILAAALSITFANGLFNSDPGEEQEHGKRRIKVNNNLSLSVNLETGNGVKQGYTDSGFFENRQILWWIVLVFMSGSWAVSFYWQRKKAREARERKNLEDSLKAVQIQLDKFSVAVEQSPSCIVITDAAGTIEYVNPTFTRDTGYTGEEAIGKNPCFLKTDYHDSNFYDELWQTILDGKVWKGEFLNKKKNGEFYWEKAIITPIVNAKHEIISFLAVKENITKQKKTEQALQESEEKFRHIFEYTDIGIILGDKDGNILKVNPAFCKMLGCAEHEVESKNFIDYAKTAEIKSLETELYLMDQLLEGKIHYYNLKRKYITKKQKTIWLNVTVSLNRDYQGNPLYFIWVVQEITLRKETEQASRESEERFRMMADTVPVLIWMAQPDKGFNFVNKTWLEFTGRTLEQESGNGWTELIHPDDYERCFQNYVIHFDKQQPFQMEYRFMRSDGQYRWILNNGVPRFNLDGNFLGYIGSCIDIHDRKQLEDYLKEAKDSAEAASLSKSEFLANMSHEIRTPMNAVLGFTDILYSEITDKKHKAYLESIRDGANNLLKLINDILDLSKIEAGKIKLKPKIINLNSLFAEIGQIFALEVSQKDLTFQWKIESNVPSALYLDEMRLRQALLNLVGNAVKFTERGHIMLSAQVSGYNPNTEYVDMAISVQDTGIGISPEAQTVIFDPFEHQYYASAKFGGMGLGLTIARRLVEMMNGQIRVDSTLGKGSVFTVELHNVTVPHSSYATQKNLPVDNPDDIVLDTAAILVADDVDNNRKLIKTILKRTKQIEVLEAQNGEEAISITEKYNPDLILMDIRMPVMDGCQAAMRIKKDSKLKHIPVIAMSASVLENKEKKSRDFSFDGYVIKPINMDDLLKEISRVLRNKPALTTEEFDKQQPLSMSPEAINKLPELVVNLDGPYRQIWESIKNNNNLSEIYDFAQLIEQAGKDYSIAIVQTYGSKLTAYAEKFDVENIIKLLNQYSALVESLKGKERELR